MKFRLFDPVTLKWTDYTFLTEAEAFDLLCQLNEQENKICFADIQCQINGAWHDWDADLGWVIPEPKQFCVRGGW